MGPLHCTRWGCSTPAWVVGPGCGRLRRWTGPSGVSGVVGAAVLCVVVGPHACFPSGPSVSQPFWFLDSACDPVPRPSLCVVVAPPRRCWTHPQPRTPNPVPGR